MDDEVVNVTDMGERLNDAVSDIGLSIVMVVDAEDPE